MKLKIAGLQILFCLLICGTAAHAQLLDISSGGPPTITGALGGSVTGSSSNLNNLQVTVNFGEIGPANTSNIVKVTVPVAIRSLTAYTVSVSIVGGASASPQGIQATDVGFGIVNFRSLGANAKVCTHSSHVIAAPFAEDPASNVTINSAGRAAYPSSLGNVILTTTIVSGPQLSQGLTLLRQANNGYAFDAVFTITPQFYTSDTNSAVLTFTILPGLSLC